MKKYIAALVVTLMLAGTALGGDKAAKADAAKRQAAIQNTAIIAGQSIGELRLGMGMDEVESMLGKPSGWKYLPTGGKSVSEASSWFYNDLNLEIFFGRGAVPVVTSIRTAGWPHKRIKSGNFAWKDIDPSWSSSKPPRESRLAPRPSTSSVLIVTTSGTAKRGQFMNYASLGLFFDITSDHIVYGIQVSKPQ